MEERERERERGEEEISSSSNNSRKIMENRRIKNELKLF
jgi:hypothetical protein